MQPDLPLRVAHANIHSKIFDDEVVIIDMLSGVYFSLRGAAVDMWRLLEPGASPDAIVAALTTRYEAPGETVSAAARAFLALLATEGLIIAGTTAVSAGVAACGDAPAPARTAFVPPELERFTDMQDLLLLDPIHEVTDSGWPHNSPPSPAG